MADDVRLMPLADLYKRKSVKWRRYPNDVLPLWVAEMDFPIAEPIKDALRDMIDRSDTGYLGPFPELFESYSNFARELWGWQPDISQMRIATDVGVGAVEVIRTLINPGDGMVINSPVYENFWNWVNELKAKLVDVAMKKSGLDYSIDLDALEVAYKSGAKVHLLSNPHNPIGIVHDRETLAAIAELAKKYGVVIISDEIHAPLTYSEKKFTPFLSVSETAREVGITITSASKAFNLAGLKCAMIITENESLRDRINLMPLAVAFRASLFGATAATAAFQRCRPWLNSVIGLLDENRKLLKNLIDMKLPGVGYRVPDFGYLAWIDLTSLNLGDDPCERLLERGRVALVKGSAYGPQHQSFARLNFGTNPEIIAEGINRIAKSI